MSGHVSIRRLVIWLIPFALGACVPGIYAQDAGSEVHNKLRAGESVRLPNQPQIASDIVKSDQIIPAEWIEELAVDKVVKRPIVIENAFIQGPLSLESVVFKSNVSFRNCRFSGSVDFHFTTFEGSITFSASKFLHDADFRAVHAKRELRITGSTFEGKASFQDIHVEEQMNANGVKFHADVNFVRAELSKSVFFNKDDSNRAEFGGSAKFQGMHVHGALSFKNSVFWKDCIFQNVQVDGSAFFDEGTEFKSKADFTLAHIYENAVFTSAKFNDEVRFDWIKIEGSAQFWETGKKAAEFWDTASFSSAVIGSDAIFTGIYFARKAFFDDLDFKGSTQFMSVQFKDDADFSGAKFSKGLTFDGARFWGRADFTLAAGRDIHFPNVEFRKSVSLRECHFQIVYFGDTSADDAGVNPSKALFESRAQTRFFEGVEMGGLTYDRIYGNIQTILEHMRPFERQPYVQLEQYLRKIGADDEADDIYLERRSQESRQISFWHHPAVWLGNFLYRYSANYGILDWRLIAWISLFLGFGCWLFSHSGTVEAKKENCQATTLATALSAIPMAKPVVPVRLTWRQALAFAVHEFLPLSILIGDKWIATSIVVPIKVPCVRWSLPISSSGYSTLLRAVGWIIIPVAVAALTGLLRRASS